MQKALRPSWYRGPGWQEACPQCCTGPYALHSVEPSVGGRAVAIPGSDATSQDDLDGAAVELFENLGIHDKSFQSPEGEKVLSCCLHDYLAVFGP